MVSIGLCVLLSALVSCGSARAEDVSTRVEVEPVYVCVDSGLGANCKRNEPSPIPLHQNALPRAITTPEPSPTQPSTTQPNPHPSSTNLDWLTKTTIEAETATASSKPSSTNPAPIVGGVVGGVAALLLAVVGGWLLARRRTRMTVDESDIERWNENGGGAGNNRRENRTDESGSGSEGVQHEHHQNKHKQQNRPSQKIKTDVRERYEPAPEAEMWDSRRQGLGNTRSPLSPRSPHSNSPYRSHPLRQMSSHQSRRSEMSLDLPMQH
ncbi:uncharacterized protein C8A04DRAFT_26165 [Dichotomopilus funicola]|uniref:Uncharacterized protein n=1 Tax=Dichotomopilus funicola TaxID=1934379 RepID=A0AAN6V748_9PEZI|nr:hypothetical protein C8A04DRAFT_26165 [Dichotomopilus funicola]